MQITGSEVEIIDQLAEKLEKLGYQVSKDAKINGQSGAVVLKLTATHWPKAIRSWRPTFEGLLTVL